MRVRILGSAAGGGLPQWNCGCVNCERARRSGAGRTQSSVAVSADSDRWVLLNVSPDVRQQLAAHPRLWPGALRQTTISAVILTDAEIDHTLGLMLLRESAERLAVYASSHVIELLEREWPLFRVLDDYCGVERCALREEVATPIRDIAGRETGLVCTVFPLARRPPRYAHDPSPGTCEVGLRLEHRNGGATVTYIPAAAAIDGVIRRFAEGADLLLFDGTFWSEDELRHLGVRAPDARAMGHLPIGGRDGSLGELSSLGAKRLMYVHINNTNPILDSGSAEHAAVRAAGVEIAEDGMELEV